MGWIFLLLRIENIALYNEVNQLTQTIISPSHLLGQLFNVRTVAKPEGSAKRIRKHLVHHRLRELVLPLR
jgi:hypothetical protein